VTVGYGRWPGEQTTEGIALLPAGLAAYRATGAARYVPFSLTLLADAEGKANGRHAEAREANRRYVEMLPGFAQRHARRISPVRGRPDTSGTMSPGARPACRSNAWNASLSRADATALHGAAGSAILSISSAVADVRIWPIAAVCGATHVSDPTDRSPSASPALPRHLIA
jgi:hypothetical protein